MNGFKAIMTIGVALSAAQALADTFPPQVRGSYSPDGTCPFDERMIVGEDSVDIELAGDVLTLHDWDVCLTCAGGARYTGIEVMSFPRLGLQENPVFRFNADERQGIVVIEYGGPDPLPIQLAEFVRATMLQKCS